MRAEFHHTSCGVLWRVIGLAVAELVRSRIQAYLHFWQPDRTFGWDALVFMVFVSDIMPGSRGIERLA